MHTLFDGNTVLSYLPMDQTFKVCVKNFWQKRIILVCTDRWKSDIAAFLELDPGMTMTHRHPANRKTGSPFVPQVRLISEIGPSGPRTTSAACCNWPCFFRPYDVCEPNPPPHLIFLLVDGYVGSFCCMIREAFIYQSQTYLLLSLLMGDLCKSFCTYCEQTTTAALSYVWAC